MTNNRTSKTWTGVAARNLRLGMVLALSVFALTSVTFAQTAVQDTLSFQGGIGVINVIGQNADASVKLNVVRGVNPAGPWRIASLTAAIRSDGRISVVGRGLLLAAGEGVATNAGASVHATLFCGAVGSATEFDEPGVKLDAAGNFAIDDVLRPITATASSFSLPCEKPVLLIRSGATPGQGVWFAAGIPSSGLSTAN
jgi:hypothetical protein